MGGGDLNLKKSWHPSTLRNIERVWKAEQKHEVEKQKIEQLQKELAAERAREEIQAFAEEKGVVKKRDERLDWMYQGPAAMVNREDYLLGRKIDKTLELLEQQETGAAPPKEEESRIGSIFCQGTSDVAVDLANKIREDPLFSIMKKEKEQRKNLLTNPVKMKQLQEILKASLNENKKSKKSKKEKKKRRMSSDSSSSSEDEKHYKRKNNKTKHFESREDRERKDYYKSMKRGSDYDDYNRKKYDSYRRSPDRSNSRYRNGDQKSDRQDRHRQENHSKRDEQNKRQLDSKERDRRLREMQENAKWREEQRERNAKRYQQEDEKEDHFERIDTEEFLRPMLSKTAVKGSLENRVKQKIFTIQRNNSDMNKHFARR